jgi:hypothetical protein
MKGFLVRGLEVEAFNVVVTVTQVTTYQETKNQEQNGLTQKGTSSLSSLTACLRGSVLLVRNIRSPSLGPISMVR